MNNAYFEDFDAFIFSTNFYEFIHQSRGGYFVTLCIDKFDVLTFMEHDIIPIHMYNGDFAIKVHLSNLTDIQINGLKLLNLSDERLSKIPLSSIILDEIALKRYSPKSNNKAQCYATKMYVTLRKREL